MVTCNLTGVELVLMTSPEGDHQSNGLAEVGVREIKAQTRILRSQLEQRFGSRIEEKDPLMSWIPGHAAKCVSRDRNENCKNGGTREMGSRVQCNVCWSSLAIETGSAESGETCCT